MRQALVNIGLAVNDGSAIRPDHALAALRAIGGVRVLLSRVLPSDTEPTLVAEVVPPLNATGADAVARFLNQEAIAQWDGRDGELYGPNAGAWRPFDPAFFLNLDGSRLQPPIEVAA